MASESGAGLGGVGFRGLGFRVLGFRSLGVWGIGFRGLGQGLGWLSDLSEQGTLLRLYRIPD